MKTLAELALEYAHKVQLFWDGDSIDHHIVVLKEMAFLAGYQAAKEKYEARIKELEQAIIKSVDAMAGVQYDDENT